MKTGKVLFIGFMVCSFFLMLLIPTAAAIHIDISGDLPAEVKEGDIVEFDLTISGISKASGLISFETDLVVYGNNPLYNFTDLNITTNSNNYILNLNDSDEVVTVQVKGKVPIIKEIIQVDKLTLVKMDSKRTGYAYYRFKLMDSERNPLKEGDTRVFSISVPEIESFENKLESIDDPFFRSYLTNMFNKGLVYESNELADHLNSRDEGASVSLVLTAAGVIVAFVAGIIIGIRVSNSEGDDDL